MRPLYYYGQFQNSAGDWFSLRVFPVENTQTISWDNEFSSYYSISFDSNQAIWGIMDDGSNTLLWESKCFLSYNDTLSTDFRWFCVNFNHFDDEDSHFLPDETMNKLFTGADGETLYTDDGYQYKLSTMPWCQDGTCKR